MPNYIIQFEINNYFRDSLQEYSTFGLKNHGWFCISLPFAQFL